MSSSRRSVPFRDLSVGMRLRLKGGEHVTVERIEPVKGGRAQVFGRDDRGVHFAPIVPIDGTVIVLDDA